MVEIIEINAAGEEALVTRLHRVLSEQAAEHGVSFSHRDVLLEARVGGDFAGGLGAKLGRAFMFIELLAVEPGLRGQGIGRALMERAEAIARAAGVRGIWVDSFTFQAPGFYARLGFVEFGRIDDYLPGHDRVFLAKRLEPGASS